MNTISHNKVFKKTAILLLIATLSQSATLFAESVRSELGNIQGGISIQTAPPAGTTVYAVEETLPSGAFPRRISHNGFFDPHTNKVKWGPFFDDSPRALRFEVSIGDGDLPLAGTMSHDASGPIPTNGIEAINLPNFETYFAGWQNRYLPVNTPLLSPDYVPPGSRLSLLAQYAMGLHPGDPDLPLHITLLPNGQTEVSYLRDIRRGDVSMELQASGNLQNWISWDPPSSQIETVDPFREAIHVPADPNNPFYRIVVSEEKTND